LTISAALEEGIESLPLACRQSPRAFFNYNSQATLMAEERSPSDSARPLARIFIKISHRG
jgi:hypothetical protein